MDETRNPAEVLDAETERALLEEARRGDHGAFSRLVEAYRDRAFGAALAILQNADDARDLSQDAFVKAYRALDRFDVRRRFYPWLYRILHNGCLNHLKRHGPSRKVSLDEMGEEHHLQFEAPNTDPVEAIHAEQMARHLRDAIERLDPKFREIIVMKHFQEMSYQDIADALEIPIGTVMSRLFHARKNLAALMEKHRP